MNYMTDRDAYIAGPFTSYVDEDGISYSENTNTVAAQLCGARYMRRNPGAAVYVPHSMGTGMSHVNTDYVYWMRLTAQLQRLAQVTVLMQGWHLSTGATVEALRALRAGHAIEDHEGASLHADDVFGAICTALQRDARYSEAPFRRLRELLAFDYVHNIAALPVIGRT
jgi:hypothetical protein